MGILTVLVVLTLCMVVHEGGHLFAMLRSGIPVQRAGIGLGSFIEIRFPRFPRISNLSKDKSKPFVLTISPILVGAYVKPTEEGERMLEQLPYASKVNVYGAGPLANIVFSLLVLEIWSIFVNPHISLDKLLVALCAIFLGMGLFRRVAPIFGYVIPIIGALAIVGIVTLLLVFGAGAVAGPIGIFQEGPKIARDFNGSIGLLFVISISLGFLNLLPLAILDGGRIAEAILERSGAPKKWRSLYSWVSAACLIVFVVFVFGNDIARLFLK